MGRHEQRCVAIAAGALQQLEHMVGRFDVEVAGRLVRQHELRLVNHGARNRDPLLLAARNVFGKSVRAAREAELRRAARGCAAAPPPRANAVQRQRQLDVLADRQGRNEVEGLEHEAEALPPPARPLGLGQRGEIGAVDADAACVGGLEAADQAQQRRLAGAAATHDGNELPALDGQAGAVENGLLPVALADILELDPGRCDGVHKSILRRSVASSLCQALLSFPAGWPT